MNWKDPLLSVRGTGRTERMLTACIAAAKTGRHVMVVSGGCENLIQHAHRLAPAGVDVEVQGANTLKIGPGTITIVGHSWQGVDMEAQRVQGVDVEDVFIDHYAFEQHFGRVIRGWMRWNTPRHG